MARLRFFHDKHGQLVIWQWPNLPVYGWLAFQALSALTHSPRFKEGFDNIATAFLFTWAFLELTQGVNYFRRLLGLVVLAYLISSYIKLA